MSEDEYLLTNMGDCAAFYVIANARSVSHPRKCIMFTRAIRAYVGRLESLLVLTWRTGETYNKNRNMFLHEAHEQAMLGSCSRIRA